jgi:hypothetical protein
MRTFKLRVFSGYRVNNFRIKTSEYNLCMYLLACKVKIIRMLLVKYLRNYIILKKMGFGR